MMIDFALQAEREQGLPPVEAIYQACLLRFRPIMIDTMAALLAACRWPSHGLVPSLRSPGHHTIGRRTDRLAVCSPVHDPGRTSFF